MNATHFKKSAALLTLGVLGAGALLQPTPARAADKEKLYKGGAVALGVLGAYYAVKGKTVPGVIAGAGAYYAYKKGQDENDDYDRNDDRNQNRDRDRNRTARNDFRLDDYLNRGNRTADRRNDDYRYDDNRYPDYSLR